MSGVGLRQMYFNFSSLCINILLLLDYFVIIFQSYEITIDSCKVIIHEFQYFHLMFC